MEVTELFEPIKPFKPIQLKLVLKTEEEALALAYMFYYTPILKASKISQEASLELRRLLPTMPTPKLKTFIAALKQEIIDEQS